MFGPTALLTLAHLICRSYASQTTLYLPNFDSQPLSVDFISTDSQGRNAWAVHATGTDAFPGVLTLVEASDYVSEAYTYDGQTVNAVCSLTSSTATCTYTAGATVSSLVEPVTMTTVDVGVAAPSASSTGSSSSATSSTSASSSSSGIGNVGTSSTFATSKSTASIATSTATTGAKSSAARTATLMYGKGSIWLPLVVILSLFTVL